ncbi:hypothetical protein [Bradyrhizobium arachidis]|uniref:Uncharacterized protein n=1 Tax=Bradyrhizobium arachidis TaxID=858423 RepID=A0AAE7NKF1_9BRAD|nr:hypothetical protein [Bradyrhizobium arachidis]QOZ66936.1 hypothetical protein WN72_11895 [Bradyrhizobium arachidis]SFV13816.1 hypothetical protein SAMN05192541_120122 [Bradyrhizobium arachidis]
MISLAIRGAGRLDRAGGSLALRRNHDLLGEVDQLEVVAVQSLVLREIDVNSLVSAILVALGGLFVVALGLALITFAMRNPAWCAPNESAAECFRNWLVAVVPVLAFVAAIVAAAFAFGQMCAAQKQLRQMQDQTALARQQFDPTQRPWIIVAVDKPTIEPFGDDEMLKLNVHMKNIGSEPALHVVPHSINS